MKEKRYMSYDLLEYVCLEKIRLACKQDKKINSDYLSS